ncbi:MAG: hypothetical protein A2X22_12445 [Bacteroidetes bacterium GWF2_49_14]|nr:MAG: hypothetical protein A2X22_12445 [Bacteroidetes bacterium GWF2_49_14]
MSVMAARVAKPTFSPGSGTYNSAKTVYILCSTYGATIRYTTDGTNPTSSHGTLYTGPVTVEASLTLKAIAYRSNYANSYVGSATYVINLPPAGAPVFSPGPGGYGSPQAVQITSSTSEASIRYTIDGSTPTTSGGILYTDPVEIDQNVTLKAIAYKGGLTNSGITSGLYTIRVATPAMNPEPGTFTEAQSVTLSCATSGAIIKYSLDGTMPSQAYGTVYSGPLTLNANSTLKAMAYKSGMIDSDVVSGTFSFSCAAPVFEPAAGVFSTATSVTLSTATSGASIRYTTDGTAPGASSGTVYQEPIEIAQNKTIRAIAYKSGLSASSISEGSFVIQCAAPVFSPAAGTFANVQEIALTSLTPSSGIRYTTDGTDPSASAGLLYNGSISVNATSVLKAVAYKEGMGDSPVVAAGYTLRCAVPAFTPDPGTHERPQQVQISTETVGATIRYTTNGEDPTPETGTVYTQALAVNADATFKAIAVKSGFTNSDIGTGSYIIGLPDRDGDGIPDIEDDYPDDSLRALTNNYPAAGPGTLAFEDLWPAQGDYDMNDLVIDYQFKTVTNASNFLVETLVTIVLRASGASLKSGFGFQFASGTIPSAAMKVTGHQLTNAYITLNENGTEAGQEIPTIIVFDNVFDILKSPGTGSGVNTDPNSPYVEPVTISVTITYTPDTYTDENLNIEEFNPFLIVNMQRGREVHLLDYKPTSLADPKLLGTSGDYSKPSENKYYHTASNLPWALNICESFDYPKEKALLIKAYLHFAAWAQSGGTEYPDWYRNIAGYRDPEMIYQKRE